MYQQNNGNQYYLFAFSNFLAAFGGGIILGKGIGVIDVPYLKGGSILAFFVGTVLGLIFLQSIPKKISEVIARWFSIFAGMTSLALFYIFSNNEVHNKLMGDPAIIFFALLSIRFGFWFFSRVLRASAAAGQQQSIAWVELGYYVGVIFGLIIWKLLGFELSMVGALLLDASLQLSAGILDYAASRITKNKSENRPEEKTSMQTPHTSHFEKKWSLRLASAVVFLTVGIQVVIFNLAHQVADWFGTYVLAFFYLGVSLAAITYKKFKIELDWFPFPSAKRGYAALITGMKKKTMTFSIISILAALCVMGAVIGTVNLQWGALEVWGEAEIILICLIMIAAFLYEILTLALLDRIGFEEKVSNRSGMIIRTYGFMGISAAVTLWFLGFIENSLIGLLATLLISLLLSVVVVRTRNTITLMQT